MENSNYDLVLEIVKSYEDENVLSDFLNDKCFEKGKNVSKEEFFEFFTEFTSDGSDYHYVTLNWEYVESGGDESVYSNL